MSDLLKDGLLWLSTQRRANMATQVTYRRASTSLSLLATFGRPDKETVDADNVRVSAMMIDFLISASDFEDAFTEPQRGDKITVDDREYEVMDFAGQGHWRWSGIPGNTMRIHTKQIS